MPIECWIKFDSDSEGGDKAEKPIKNVATNTFIKKIRRKNEKKDKNL